MNTVETLGDGAIIASLCRLASQSLGCDPSSVAQDPLRRWLAQQEREGLSRHEVLRRLELGDLAMLDGLTDAVCVGETYFFRHPEQFQFIMHELVPAWRSAPARKIRAWSAGCADGVEAYSLAACLRASLPSPFDVEVLGSDVSPRALAAAHTAVYGRSAVRDSAPLLFPVLKSMGGGLASVHDTLREITSFTRHNLLSPASFGQFDLVFCRNVLVYFTREAAERVVHNLLSALAPGGVLIFGPMDLQQKPRELERVRGAELQVFKRRSVLEPSLAAAPPPTLRSAVRPPEPRPQVSAPSAAVRPAPASDSVACHLQALASIERGETEEAARLLWALRGEETKYLPGILELALLEARRGNQALAVELVHELRAACAGLPDDFVLPGPEPMAASFYASMAELFLLRGGSP